MKGRVLGSVPDTGLTGRGDLYGLGVLRPSLVVKMGQHIKREREVIIDPGL